MEKSKKIKFAITSVVVVIVLAIGGLLSFFLLRKKDDFSNLLANVGDKLEQNNNNLVNSYNSSNTATAATFSCSGEQKATLVSDSDTASIQKGEETFSNYIQNANLVIGYYAICEYLNEHLNPLKLGKTYYYKVKAANSAGTSDYSSYTSVTLEDTRKPGPVTYGYCSATSTSITLKWQIPTDSSYGKPTKIILRLYDPTYDIWVDAQELPGTATTVTFPFGMWVDSGGYVKCGVIPYNEYGSGGGTAKVYDTKNKKWLI